MLRGRGAFSLAELLVVIAIMSILASMLFPVMTTAKRSAYRSSCANNFRQIGTALSLYVGDNNGRYPYAMAGARPEGFTQAEFDGNWPGVGGLVYSLYKYCKSSQVWMCISGPKRQLWGTEYTSPAGTPVDYNWSMVNWIKIPDGPWISTNYASFPFNRHDGYMHPVSDSPECAQGRTPEEYITMCGHVFSSGGVWGYMNQAKLNGRILQDTYTGQGDNPYWSHGGGTNVLYYDGRTGWVRDPRAGRGDQKS